MTKGGMKTPRTSIGYILVKKKRYILFSTNVYTFTVLLFVVVQLALGLGLVVYQ